MHFTSSPVGESRQDAETICVDGDRSGNLPGRLVGSKESLTPLQTCFLLPPLGFSAGGPGPCDSGWNYLNTINGTVSRIMRRANTTYLRTKNSNALNHTQKNVFVQHINAVHLNYSRRLGVVSESGNDYIDSLPDECQYDISHEFHVIIDNAHTYLRITKRWYISEYPDQYRRK